MKKLLIAAAVAATFVAPQAFAQAKNFQGFSVGTNINSTSSTVVYGNEVTGNSSNIDLQIQYSLGLGDSFVLGLGVGAGLSDYKVAANANMKNTTSVFITPGIAVNDTMLIYGKFGAIQGSFAIEPSPTLDMTGTTVGIGLRSLINKNVFVQGEFTANKYNDKISTTGVTGQSKANYFSFGIGYLF